MDPYHEELIGAFLDGEVSAEERSLVERLLAESTEHRRLFEELRHQSQLVRSQLVRGPLLRSPFTLGSERDDSSPDIASKVLAEMRSRGCDAELLTAYLDNEVTAVERQQVESQLAESAESRSLLAQLRDQRAMVHSSPRYSPPARFDERVVAAIEAAKPNAARHPSVLQPAATASPNKKTGTRDWSTMMLGSGLLAAGLLIAVTVWMNRGPSEPPVFVAGNQPVSPAADIDDATADQLAANFQQSGGFCLVYDLRVSASGQTDKAVETLLLGADLPRHAGIALTPAMQSSVLESQFLGEEIAPVQANEAPSESVEMFFIRGLAKQVSDLHAAARKRSLEVRDVQIRADMILAPADLRALMRLDRATQSSSVASNSANGSFPLQFIGRLKAISSKRFAAISGAGLQIEAPAREKSSKIDLGELGKQPIAKEPIAQAPKSIDTAEALNTAEKMKAAEEVPSFVILIVRNRAESK